jgi:uncharacterized BrkB/YihY/UPF0761 family membrane protein
VRRAIVYSFGFVAVPLFLIWIYVSWIIVLAGAALTAVLADRGPRRRREGAGNARRPAPALAVAADSRSGEFEKRRLE